MKAKIFFMVALICLSAGCANTSQEQKKTPTSASGSTIAETPSNQYVVKQSEIEDDSSISFDYKGSPAILIAVGGKYYAYINKCSLEGCKMAYKEGKLICPCCGSVFEASSGEPISGRAKDILSILPVSVTDGNLYVSA